MTKTIALVLFSFGLAAMGLSAAHALPVSQIQGSNWKTECAKEGGSRYACCQGKESACSAGCQSGNTCGNACTQCKNECAASYKVCTAKKVSLPGTAAPAGQAPVRSNRN